MTVEAALAALVLDTLVPMKRDLTADLRRFGGLCRRSALLDLGHSDFEIAEAVRTRILRVPRRGWVAGSDAPHGAVRAVQLGGKLGGSSALACFGVWIDTDDVLVVSILRGSARLPSPGPNERRVWGRPHFPELSDLEWRVSLRDAILQHARVCGRSEMIAVLDSALHGGLLPNAQLPGLLERLPLAVRPHPRELDAASMSGTESHLRVACRARGYRVTTQASITNVGDVDLLIDGWLIVECDSKKFHGSEDQQRKDRKRDGNARLGNRSSVRFTYAQVMFERDWCMDVIAAALAAG